MDPTMALLQSAAAQDAPTAQGAAGLPIPANDPTMTLLQSAHESPWSGLETPALGTTSVHASTVPKLGLAADIAHQIPLMDKAAAVVGATFPSISPLAVRAGDWGSRYHGTLTNIRSGLSGFEGDNPNQAEGAKAAGVVGPMLVGGGESSLLGTMLKSGAIGGAYGLSGTDDSSLTGDLTATGIGAAVGAGMGMAGHAAGSMAGSAGGAIADRFTGNTQTRGQKSAAQMLADTLKQQGIGADELTTQLQGNKPLTPLDVGGDNAPLARLGRMLTVLPGKPGEDITSFLNARQTGAPGIPGQRGRVLGDISQLAPDTDTYGAQAGLSQERSVNSNPLYQQAFANAGVGPVDYEADRTALISATAQKGALAKQIKSVEQNNSGALASRGAAGSDVRANYMDLHQQLQDAEATRQAAASKFENTQTGVSAMESNQPLTDSRLADFMKDQDIRAGMQKGLNIQKRISLANDEQFDPNAYAITGYDEKGLPQVGPVPTWRTLHAGREGLDATLNEFRDPFTYALPNTKLVNSYKDLRNAYSSTLHRLNPDLAAADAAWSDPSQKKDAINLGQMLLKADPEQISAAQSRMNPDTISYHQMGAGRALRDVANDTRDNNNIPMRLNGDQTTRDQIGAAFGPDAAGNFAGNMDLENRMAKTRQFVTGGSNTANKAADVAASGPWHLPTIINDAITGFAAGGPKGAVVVPGIGIAKRSSSKLLGGIFNNEDRNSELAKVLMATGSDAGNKVQDLLTPAQQRQRAIAIGKLVGGTGGRGATALSLGALMSPTANYTGQ